VQPQLAVLIDGDNIAANAAGMIFAHVTELGRPIIKRIYGKAGALNPWTEPAHEHLYELRPLASVTPSKNGTDIALTIEAMDLLYAGAIQAFCLVSNDRDFVPLAIRLRAAGKSVHAICRQSDQQFSKAFDSVLELERRDPIVEAFRKIAGENELGLSEAGKLLRDSSASALIPAAGKGRLRKVLEATGHFAFSGAGPATRVKLVTKAVTRPKSSGSQ